jgi:hypothetical protein
MVDFVSYPANMHNDFELYSNNQEQQLEFPLNGQPFHPTATYGMQQTFSTSYDPMMHLEEAPRPHDLQYHYDAIAQGVKPFHYQTPAASPLSTSNSFHEQPSILSASSESGASVSSSTMGSPSHFPEPWNPVALNFTPGFDYPGMFTADKAFVGESISRSTTTSSSASALQSYMSPVERSTFRIPVVPASANWPVERSRDRRSSHLSRELIVCDAIPTTCSPSADSSLQSHQFLQSSCRFSNVTSRH